MPRLPRRPVIDWPTYQAVLARDGWRCQASAYGFGSVDPCAGELIVHHRRLRSQGGGHELDNLVTLCGGVTGTGGHHGEVHRFPARAAACGLILRAGS